MGQFLWVVDIAFDGSGKAGSKSILMKMKAVRSLMHGRVSKICDLENENLTLIYSFLFLHLTMCIQF